tara:strand:- start:122560 stop:122751 length:192 start_codon:yes stop_codon:yes gene_type:complete
MLWKPLDVAATSHEGFGTLDGLRFLEVAKSGEINFGRTLRPTYLPRERKGDSRSGGSLFISPP